MDRQRELYATHTPKLHNHRHEGLRRHRINAGSIEYPAIENPTKPQGTCVQHGFIVHIRTESQVATFGDKVAHLATFLGQTPASIESIPSHLQHTHTPYLPPS